MMKIQTIIVLAFVLVSTSAQASDPRFKKQIINGDLLREDQIPQMTTLDADGAWTCSATLIGPRVIITAGHCSEGAPEQNYGPIAGKIHRVKMENHPQYEGSDNTNVNIPHDFAVKHDISLGLLPEAVVGVEPVSVTSAMPSPGDSVLIAGRGRPQPGVRQFGFLNVLSLSDIGLTLRGFGQIQQTADSGDSGGTNYLLADDGTIRAYGITSTSTRVNDWSEHFGELAKPYTTGVSKIFPSPGAQMSPFLEDFAKTHGVEICGVNRDCAPVKFIR